MYFLRQNSRLRKVASQFPARSIAMNIHSVYTGDSMVQDDILVVLNTSKDGQIFLNKKQAPKVLSHSTCESYQ